MKKQTIAIITQLSLDSVNFGNHLQAFALNDFINKNYGNVEAITLQIKAGTGIKFTSVKGCLRYYYLNIKKKVYRTVKGIKPVELRLKRFRDFANTNINISDHEMKMAELKDKVYDKMIVGSDVVWYQYPGYIDMPRFLPFYKNVKKRYSYAASFGNEKIPNENVKLIKYWLGHFEKISVRESVAAKMLLDIGIDNVEHVCDPTLLLTPKEWRGIAHKPQIIDEQKIDKYVFAYFLGSSEQKIDKLKAYYENQGFRVLYIPYINGLIRKKEKNDLGLIDCSPQEWIWLIDNAKYVITDSFHGLVFSVLFEKSFVCIRRVFSDNINSRIVDFLKMISANDKLIDLDEIDKVKEMKWEFEQYIASIQRFIADSKEYLNSIIGD